jgi:LemA protein
MIALLVLLVIIAVIVFWVIGVYNRLVSLRNRFKNAFAQIDVQLKRRYDLIPNLVEVAKGYMKHERETLEAVIAARNQAVTANSKAVVDPSDAASVQQLAAAEGTLTASLGKMFALSEAYPDLKANENMIQLTEELTSTENKIAFARQAYNDSVMQYNTGIEQFPGSVIAKFFRL